MTVAYFGRLVCLCLAAFFVLHTALAMLVSFSARIAIRRAARMRADVAARLLFGLRLLPATGAAFLVGGLCIPSYFLWEPESTTEQIGPACLIAAFLGAVACGSGLARGTLAAIRSAGYLRRCQELDAPMFLLAGVFHPRLMVSPSVRNALTPDEFQVALRHEEAHGRSRDNLKRWLILLSPDMLPFLRGFDALDAGWHRLAEWAADDWAVQGSAERGLTLASALVRVGRMCAGVPLVPMASSLPANANDLGARVERLIEGRRAGEPTHRRPLLVTACVIVAGVLAFGPQLLYAVHLALETLTY